MTENEHNYKGPTPMNVTYARFEIQLIDLPRSQASQVFGRKRNCERSGLVTNPPERACSGTREACPDCALAVFDSRFVYI